MAADKADHPQCGAAPRANSARKWPCRRRPAIGEKRCKLHGGVHPKSKQNRAGEMLKRKTEKAVRRLKMTPVEDPLTELKKIAGEVLAWKNAMFKHVKRLHTLRYYGEKAEQIRGEVILYERAIERCVTILTNIAKLNIDERLAAVTERQAEMMEDALFAAFDAAGLGIRDADQKQAIAEAFSRQLTLVG